MVSKAHVSAIIQTLATTKPPQNIEELSKKSGLSVDKLKKYSVRMEQNAYLAFAPPFVDIAVAALGAHSRLSAVQVGANDGREGDPVFDLINLYCDKVILIEPVPELIDKLKESYKNFSGTSYVENVAIGASAGEFGLYRLRPSLWDEYVRMVGRHPTQISSFNKQLIFHKVRKRLRLSDDQTEDAIERLSCPMHPLSHIVQRNGFDKIDFLQIDCEGYDMRVIESLGDYRPLVINFESMNLSVDDWSKWKAWASQNDYGYVQGRQDTIAVKGGKFKFELT